MATVKVARPCGVGAGDDHGALGQRPGDERLRRRPPSMRAVGARPTTSGVGPRRPAMPSQIADEEVGDERRALVALRGPRRRRGGRAAAATSAPAGSNRKASVPPRRSSPASVARASSPSPVARSTGRRAGSRASTTSATSSASLTRPVARWNTRLSRDGVSQSIPATSRISADEVEDDDLAGERRALERDEAAAAAHARHLGVGPAGRHPVVAEDHLARRGAPPRRAAGGVRRPRRRSPAGPPRRPPRPAAGGERGADRGLAAAGARRGQPSAWAARRTEPGRARPRRRRSLESRLGRGGHGIVIHAGGSRGIARAPARCCGARARHRGRRAPRPHSSL